MIIGVENERLRLEIVGLKRRLVMTRSGLIDWLVD
jgi:hypothetical protein